MKLLKRYKNLPGSPAKIHNPLKWMRFLSGMLSAKPPAVPNDFVLPRDEVLSAYQILSGADSMTWLGHAAFLLKLNRKNILLDPYLADYASPLPGMGPKRFTPPGMRVEDLPPIDILIISHNHYDHLDAKTIAALPGKENIQVIVPLSLGKFFHGFGYRHIHELDWYQMWSQDKITVRALPAYHFSQRYLFMANTTLWASYAISTADKNIYFSGDTAYGPVFKELGEKYGPFDYALLGIGAYEPQELMCSVHTTPEEAVTIGQELNARTIVGMHWGTVILSHEPAFEPPERFKKAAARNNIAEENCWIMKIGETRKI